MRSALAVVLLLAVTAASADVTAYVGATLVDPGRDVVIPDSVVVVEGGLIRAAGSAADVAVAKGARRVRLEGKWLLPGYLDVHTHISSRGTALDNPSFFGDPQQSRGTEAVQVARSSLARTLARHLRSGITTIVDVGGPGWTLAERSRQGGPAPRIFACGPIIGPARRFGGDGADGYIEIGSESEARAAVRRLADLHPDLVKFYLVPAEHTGRRFDEILPWFAAAIDEARGLGLRTTAHAMRFSIADKAVDAGIDTLAHGILDVEADRQFLDKLRERGIVISPTLMVLKGPITTVRGSPTFSEPEWQWGDPFAIADLLAAAAAARSAAGQADGGSAKVSRAVLNDAALGIAKANLKRLSDAGVQIAVGTDAGFLGILQGPSIFQEFSLMRDAGLTPKQILAAATLGGARYLGRQAQLGSLEPGKRADLVVLDADPLADIGNASRISLVVADGRAWRPDEILPPDALEADQQRRNAIAAGRLAAAP